MTECLAVRDRLAEYAVSGLSADERRALERHLEWCAGCRKEAGELREAAAAVGLSLPRVEPPETLQDEVVRRVREKAQRPSRRRVRMVRGMTVLAAVLGLLSVALAGALFARQQPLEHKLTSSRAQARHVAAELRTLVQEFHGQAAQPHNMSRATLAPPQGIHGGGGALRVASPDFEDIAVVIVGSLPQNGAPYRAWLVDGSSRRLLVGTIRVDSGGGGVAADQFAGNLRRYGSVEIRDAKGHVVLSGDFEPA